MRRVVRVLVPVLALAASVLAAVAAPAHATTFDVYPGQSIQAAIDSAPPGSTVHVHAGTYRESVLIQKDGIHLLGDGDSGSGTILKPPRSTNNPCADDPSTFPGICVAGQFDNATGALTAPTSDVEIAGFLVRNFPGEGIVTFGADHASIHNDTAATNGGYGITSFVSTGNVFDTLYVHDNGEPGFYIGDSPTANFTLTNSRSINNAMGILIREANTGTVSGNEFAGNCVGVFVLNTGGDPGNPRVTDWSINDNYVHDNSKSCPGDSEEPPVQGSGILLAGPKSVTVDSNIVGNNHGPSDNPLSGGIVLLSSSPFGGNNPVDNTISNNIANGNTPFDIRWDKSGKGNTFAANTCGSSQPAWICA
jgi:parallel beta helix pectate lyase-like protein